MDRTIKIPRSPIMRLTAEVVENEPCSECGHRLAGQELTAYYRQLGEEAAKVLYSRTPSAFWHAIRQFAVEQALVDGTVVRPLTAKDITDQW